MLKEVFDTQFGDEIDFSLQWTELDSGLKTSMVETTKVLLAENDEDGNLLIEELGVSDAVIKQRLRKYHNQRKMAHSVKSDAGKRRQKRFQMKRHSLTSVSCYITYKNLTADAEIKICVHTQDFSDD